MLGAAARFRSHAPMARPQRWPRSRGFVRLAAALALTAAFVWLWAGSIEPAWIEVTRHDVALGLSRPLRLAHLTDLHTTGMGRKEERLLEHLGREQPDVVVITGDVLHQEGTYEQTRPLLTGLRAPLGVYMVPGNWETSVRHSDLRGFLRECGVTLLLNESVEIAAGVWLVGLDDFVLGLPDLARATKSIPEGATRIALVHEPGFLDEAAGRCELVLAGHTHGGQVRLPFLPPFRLPAGCGPYVSGWYEKDASRLYVSRGIGMSGPEFRLFCRPEMPILRLH